ncbi:MAG: M28 family metallopeptidase [Acidobacteriota bacterium]
MALSARLVSLLLCLLLVLQPLAAKKEKTRPRPEKPKPRQEIRLHPQVQRIVREISASNIEAIVKKLVSFETRHTLSETESDLRGIGAARRWIREELERYGRRGGRRLEVGFDEFIQPAGAKLPRSVQIVNVVATLPGKQLESKDRIFVVSAHYDSRASDPLDASSPAPGANDDASGTAVVMELARVMSKYEFDATLTFLLFAGEEQGLLGSAHWADLVRQRKWALGAVIANDLVGNTRAADGTTHRDRLRVFAEGIPPDPEAVSQQSLWQNGGENDSAAKQLARMIKELGEMYVSATSVAIVYRRDRYLRSGDHLPFLDLGFPAIRVSEAREDYRRQHQNVRVEGRVQYGDLPEFVDFEYVSRVARVNAAALSTLALAPAPPANVRLETTRPEEDTTLRWEPNTEPDLAGYQILWRETTSPVWQNRQFVGNVSRYTLRGVSKDDLIFGVQAVDRQGCASLPVFPIPLRLDTVDP